MSSPVLDINLLVAAIDTAITAAGIPFGDSNRPVDVVTGKPYVVGFFNGGRVTDHTMSYRDGADVWMVLHTFGYSPDSVRVGRRRTLSAVFDLAGQVTGGWVVHTPVHSAALSIERDDRTTPTLYWQPDEFTIRLTPA